MTDFRRPVHICDRSILAVALVPEFADAFETPLGLITSFDNEIWNIKMRYDSYPPDSAPIV